MPTDGKKGQGGQQVPTRPLVSPGVRIMSSIDPFGRTVMFITRKSELTRSQLPFQAWRARRDSTVIGWSDAVAKRGSGPTQAGPWTLPLLVVGMLAVIISAGAVIAR